MSRRAEVRIGDLERDRAVDQLSSHFAAGRLDHDEFDERSVVALRAKTQTELNAVLSDLPGDSPWVAAGEDEIKRRAATMAIAVCSCLLALLVGYEETSNADSFSVNTCETSGQHEC